MDRFRATNNSDGLDDFEVLWPPVAMAEHRGRDAGEIVGGEQALTLERIEDGQGDGVAVGDGA